MTDKGYIKIEDFEQVDGKPGYYWLNKRKFEIVSENVLKKAIDKFNKEDIFNDRRTQTMGIR